MTRHVRDVMTPDPQTVTADLPAAEAARLMKDTDAGSIPVVEDSRLLGTITDRDIVVGVVAAGKDPTAVAAGEVASTDLVTIEPDRDLDEAMELMARHQVRRLPVVENGRLVGVVAQADVARHGDERRVGRTVGDIST